MDFKLTEEQKLIQNTAAQFVKRELLPREGGYLKQEELFLPPGDPPERELDPEIREGLVRRARQVGLWALELPESAGGSAMSMSARVLIHREFGRTILPFEPLTIPALMAENNHVKEIVDGEVALGFAFDEVHKTGTLQSIRTRYREIAGGYLLGNASIDVIDPGADLYLFPAKEEGTERVGLFLLDKNTPGVSVGDEVDLTTDASVGRMTLRDCKLPSEHRVGYEYEVAAIIAAEQLHIAARSLRNRDALPRQFHRLCPQPGYLRQAIGSTPGGPMDAGGPFDRFAHMHVAYPGGRLAGRSRPAVFRCGGAGQETGGEDGLPSGGHGDPDSWRLWRLQRISFRRILSRGTHDAASLRARGRDRSGNRCAILERRR